MTIRLVVSCCLALAVLALVASPLTAADALPALDKAAAEKVSFTRDVQPILKRHCWGCHSGGDAKGGLSVDTVADMLKGGDSGPLFAAGKPDESLLVEMIIGDEPEMPQKQPPLSAAKIHTLRQWVLAGAKDDSSPGESQPAIRIPDTYTFAPAVTGVALNADGTLLAAACRSEVVLVEVGSEADRDAPPRRLPTDCDLITHVEFSPDGKLLAAVGGSPAQFGEVTFFNPADGAVVSKRRVTYDTLFRGNFAPDGKAIAVGGADGAVHVVPVDAKADVRSFDLHSDWVLDVAYTPDGKMLVSGGRDKATKVCSVETGQLLRSIDSSSELISSVAADEQFAVASGKARALTSYELKTALSGIEVTGSGNGARPISKLAQYTKQFEAQPGEVFDIAMSGDRKRIAVGGAYGEVRIYTTADQKRVAVVNGLTAPIYSVALNADGSRLAVGSRDGRVQIFSLPDAKPLKSLVPVPVAAAGS